MQGGPAANAAPVTSASIKREDGSATPSPKGPPRSFKPGGAVVPANHSSSGAVAPANHSRKSEALPENNQSETISPDTIDGIMNRAMDELDRLSASMLIKVESKTDTGA